MRAFERQLVGADLPSTTLSIRTLLIQCVAPSAPKCLRKHSASGREQPACQREAREVYKIPTPLVPFKSRGAGFPETAAAHATLKAAVVGGIPAAC